MTGTSSYSGGIPIHRRLTDGQGLASTYLAAPDQVLRFVLPLPTSEIWARIPAPSGQTKDDLSPSHVHMIAFGAIAAQSTMLRASVDVCSDACTQSVAERQSH